MKELLKVSIIIPVNNAEKTFIQCVDSVLTQDYKNVECVLIENGSIDCSKALCLKYAKQYTNVIVKSLESAGVSEARNMGLSVASGDIIGFCDSDDFLEKNAISLVVNEFLMNPEIVAVFGGFNTGYIAANNCIIKEYRGISEQTISAKKALQLTIINDSVMGSVWNKYYRAESLKDKKFHNELSFCEDMHFNAIVLNSMKDTCSVRVISTPLYCYMQNSSSVTHNEHIMFNKNDELKYITALKKIDFDCKLDSKTKSLLKMKMACFAIDYLENEKIDRNKQNKLIFELKRNYICLIKNIFVNNWKKNIKRAFKSLFFFRRGL
ncbi:glycosyltransferase family A protein [Lacrimispora sp. JR3]|uniref:glycosyltransferase family A protein n=1 Tax=Lacrimispora sinapis TaxID=3111456 RepID=UPI003748AE19